MNFDTLDDDTLLCVFAFLSIPEIMKVRRTCKRLYAISQLHAVWHTACSEQIQKGDLPFPDEPLEDMDAVDLQRRTCHAYRLNQFWESSDTFPHAINEAHTNASAPIFDIHFLPVLDGRYILTVSKGIWPVLSIWDTHAGITKIADWGPKGVAFHGVAVNSDSKSSATIAVSVVQDDWQRIELLSLRLSLTSKVELLPLKPIDTTCKPILLSGDLLAYSDETCDTTLMDLKDHRRAVLRHPETYHGSWEHNRCLQVVFAHHSVLVVRARCIHLFPLPSLAVDGADPLIYEPIARHSFGWNEGVSATLRSNSPSTHGSSARSLSILIRGETDDPWATYVHTLDLYTLELDPAFAPPAVDTAHGFPQVEPGRGMPACSHVPYVFPPSLEVQVASRRGPLLCTDVVLGRRGSAFWINPKDSAVAGLVNVEMLIPAFEGVPARETLVAALFPGPLKSSRDSEVHDKRDARSVLVNEMSDWTSLDYDEDRGRVVLGSSFGRVTLVEL